MGALAATKRLLAGVSMVLSFLTAFFSPKKHLHNARFAALHELISLLGSSLAGSETSLLLGRSHFGQVLRVRPTASRRELGNLLVVAPTRGGKGLLAVSQLLTWPHSVIVNDIKGDLFLQTAGFRSTLGKVFVIDPTGMGHRYDPLHSRETEDELFSSATHLLYKPDEGEGAIFTQRATVMLTQMLLCARKEGQAPLPSVGQMIRSGLLATAAKLDTVSGALSTRFLDIEFTEADLTDRFLLSCWGTLSAWMQPLLNETVIRSLAATDFEASDLMRSEKPITVYLRWRERDLLALTPLVRLLWGSLIDELLTTYDQRQGQGCHPVLLLADEAGRTPIPSLADHATTVVGRRVYLWVAIQDLSQLDAAYGKTRAHVLRNNMESQLYYRPTDQQTADYLEHCLGKKSDFAHSQTAHHGVQTSLGLSEQGVPLLTSQDIKQLKDEDIIGFHRRLPPFQARRLDWRRFPLLVQRQAIAPPKLFPLPKPLGILPTTIWQTTQKAYIDPDRRN